MKIAITFLFEGDVFELDTTTQQHKKILNTDAHCLAHIGNGSLVYSRRSNFKDMHKQDLPYSDPNGSFALGEKFMSSSDWVRGVSYRKKIPRYNLFISTHFTSTKTRIQYLDEMDEAVPYYIVDHSEILIPSFCHPGELESWGWGGDFAFDYDNNLYLSSGTATRSAIYKITGAGLPGLGEVTGKIEPVILFDNMSAGPIEYIGDEKLIFSSDHKIFQLDLKSLQTTEIFNADFMPPVSYARSIVGMTVMDNTSSFSLSPNSNIHNIYKKPKIPKIKVA